MVRSLAPTRTSPHSRVRPAGGPGVGLVLFHLLTYCTVLHRVLILQNTVTGILK